MTHLLFITSEDDIPENLREAFTAPEIRTVVRKTVSEVEQALQHGAFDIAVLHGDFQSDNFRLSIEDLRTHSENVFIIAITTTYDESDEAVAFDAGANLYFSEPIPTQTITRLLQSQVASTQEAPIPAANISPQEQTDDNSTASTLKTIRDFSNILSYSLDYKAFTQQFILKLRDHISFSRIGIFLETSAKQSLVKSKQAHQLECVASLGLPADLVDCFQLSRSVGIGRTLCEHPRILSNHQKAQSPFDHDPTIRKEFDILGCHTAVPITDREQLIGLAVLNGPVTGRSYSEAELQLLFILMEELGLAIRNSRLHKELANHGKLIENVLSSMSSGAIVIGEDLSILYTNRSANQFLQLPKLDNQPAQWADLPAKLAGPLHRAVEKGELPEPFTLTSVDDTIYRASVIPFTQQNELALLPRPVMVIIEDFTNIEASKASEVANTRNEVISLIAERFAHEIRNSLVPLSTHAQLIDKKIEQPKFQASLKSALLQETNRIKRFSEQMLYLAQDSVTADNGLDLIQLLKDSFNAAKKFLSKREVELLTTGSNEDCLAKGNPEALSFVFQEIFLNAMQSQNGSDPIEVDIKATDSDTLRIRIKDSGPGFTHEVIRQATEPFYTTRNTGVGLGLSVAQKIIQEHNGQLRMNARTPGAEWDIEIELQSLFTTTNG